MFFSYFQGNIGRKLLSKLRNIRVIILSEKLLDIYLYNVTSITFKEKDKG